MQNSSIFYRLKQKCKEAEYVVLFVGLLVLFLMVVLSAERPIHDERCFYPNLSLFDQLGLSKQFLLEMKAQAPGPLYEIVHYSFKTITNYTFPALRILNLLLFFLIIYLIHLVKSLMFRAEELRYSLAIVALSSVWIIAGLAITEVPTMFCALLAIMCASNIINSEKTSIQVVYAPFLTFFLTLATLGRSPFLLLQAAILLVGFYSLKKPFSKTLIFSAVLSLFLVLPMFVIWKGLAPPNVAHVAKGFLKMEFAVISFAHCALLTLVLSPKWLNFSKRVISIAGILFFVSLAINLKFKIIHHEAFKIIFAKLNIPFLNENGSLIAPSVYLALATVFLASFYLNFLKDKQNPALAIVYVFFFLILMANAKNTLYFSSRYVAQAIPFLLIIVRQEEKSTWQRTLRLLLGIVFGAYILNEYYLGKYD